MTLMRLLTLILLLAGGLARAQNAPPAEAPAPPVNLLRNGDFEASDDGTWPKHWPKPAGATWELADDNHFLRLRVREPGKTEMLYLAVTLPADATALALSYRVRYQDIKPGAQAWFDGRIMMNFKDAAGQKVGGPSAPSFRGSKPEWEARRQLFAVPAGATQLELMPCLFQATAGTLDFDDFSLSPATPEELEAQLAEQAAAQRAKTRRQPGQPLLANGDFEATGKDGSVTGWFKAESATISRPVEDGNHFLRLRSDEPGKTVLVYRSLPLAPEDQAFELSYRVRYQDIKAGAKPWFDGRLMMNFKDAKGKVVGGAPSPNFRGTSKGWVSGKKAFRVPPRATSLEIMPALLQAASGTLEVDDLQLVPVDPATLPVAIPMASPVVPPPAPELLPPMLKVVGRELHTPTGAKVWLQGLSVDSLQWSAGGERIVPSIELAIEQWHANCIRLAIREDFWFGKSPYQQDGGVGYRQVVDSAVNAVAGRGAYVVLDLHRFRAPTPAHQEFWQAVAKLYANHPAVLFELFNEPHDLTWEQWRNGGEVTDKMPPKEGVVSELKDELKRFQAVGMQQLLETVRATGARNIVIAGGLDWSYDISGVLKGFALTEQEGGHGIMYSTHLYPWKKGWQAGFLEVAAQHPIFMGEVGAIRAWEDFSFIGPSQRYELAGWAEDALGLIQKHQLNWTGFSFHPRCGPMIISDWDYTPTPYWGVHVKAALAGQAFTLKNLR